MTEANVTINPNIIHRKSFASSSSSSVMTMPIFINHTSTFVSTSDAFFDNVVSLPMDHRNCPNPIDLQNTITKDLESKVVGGGATTAFSSSVAAT